CARDQSDFDYW
nr:immunoglobulin heavy chain junction region [Macaca mulatta]MOW99701.1 immunoglobulin heavy chain junction region [Macaca mulatta]MOW99705.1 immunoglobulin heavy chain junction region [Macaca mulatta]MOX00168.1 immunoglobulin heavy chain junction region [Macaca mulatta]MOX02985.1 immunoglobulin heavy chain junction region [Macaca mulatta]